MGRRRQRWLAHAVGPLLACLLGCTPEGLLVLPEQRHLAIREPSQIPPAPLPPIPEPDTVANPLPAGATRELSLDEAIRVALAHSKVVRVLAGVTASASGRTIYDPAIANTAIDEARGEFDPAVTAFSTWNRAETPQAVFDPTAPGGVRLVGPRIDRRDLGFGLTKRTLVGGLARFDLADNVTRVTPGGVPLNPEERSAATLSYTQPLLRGAGVAANIAPIVIARIDTERSFFQYKDAVQELVRGVAEAYWAVVFARVDAHARKQQVEQAEAAFEIAEARRRVGVRDGTAAAVAQTRVALSNFRATLIAAEANLLLREAALRNLLGLPPAEPAKLVLTTPPATAKVAPPWDALLKLAGERRPDLIELKLILEADDQVLLRANNQARPQLDASVLYRWNGLEGETPTGARVATGPGQFTDWSVGVNFAVPLGLRQSRAGVRRAELLIFRDRANLEQGLHSAAHLLALSVRNLAQFYEQYRAYQETRAAARINLDQQLAEVRAGRAIYLNVLQAIADWGNAISAEAQALAAYNTELANLERQTGTILETHGVAFLEERYRAAGPLGRLGPEVCYPAAAVPGPNAPRYPATGQPAEKSLLGEDPAPRPPRGPAADRPAPRPTFLQPTPLP